MGEILPVELTVESFFPFGRLLSRSDKPAACDDDSIVYTSRIYTGELGRLSSGLMRCKRREPVLRQLEKHDNTPEIMVNLGGEAVLVLAPPEFDFSREEGLRAFRTRRGDAYVLNPGVWHWASFPVMEREIDFLILFREGTEERDIVTRELAEERIIAL